MEYREANINDSFYVDQLLTKLIMDERQYDSNIDPNFIVDNYYINRIDAFNNKIYVCTDNNIIVGYIYAFINEFNNAKIDALYVEENYRNKNIASNLIDLVFNWLKEEKVNEVEISVLTNNIIAKKLYEKKNFSTFKEIMKSKINM